MNEPDLFRAYSALFADPLRDRSRAGHAALVDLSQSERSATRRAVARPRRRPFTPACMEPGDLARWRLFNDRLRRRYGRTTRPCVDCPPEFAAEMRAVGRCNGTPGGEEEEPMEPEPIDVRLHRRVPVTVSPPPCASCVHRPVCALRATVEGLVELAVAAPRVPDGLRITLTAAVECAHYLRDRRPPRPISEETRQKMRASGRARVARQGGVVVARSRRPAGEP